MPGTITVTITQNNGQSTSLTWSPTSNAAFNRVDAYIDSEYAKEPGGADRTNAQRKKAFIKAEFLDAVRERAKRRESLLAQAAITNIDATET